MSARKGDQTKVDAANPKHDAKERPCITCGVPRWSTWSGDRYCVRCRERMVRIERGGRFG